MNKARLKKILARAVKAYEEEDTKMLLKCFEIVERMTKGYWMTRDDIEALADTENFGIHSWVFLENAEEYLNDETCGYNYRNQI